MFRFIAAFFLVLSFATGTAFAQDCTAPGEAPNVPDGKTASKEEMMTAAQAVRQYNTDASAYLECMDSKDAEMAALEKQHAKDKNAEEVKKIRETRAKRLEKRNAIFERLSSTANAFNESVREYKARTQAAE